MSFCGRFMAVVLGPWLPVTSGIKRAPSCSSDRHDFWCALLSIFPTRGPSSLPALLAQQEGNAQVIHAPNSVADVLGAVT